MSSTACQIAAEPSRSTCRRLSVSLPLRWLRRVPAWLLLGIALAPVWIWYARRLDDGSDEPLGLLVLAGAVALGWRDRSVFHAGGAHRLGGALLVLGSVLAIGWLPPMLRALLAVAGVVLWCGMQRHAGLVGLLGLSLPVVASLQFYLGYPLRLSSAMGAEWLLEAAGVVVSRTGVILELAGQGIGVDPACSGIRMLWHALVAVMVLAAIHRVSWRVTLGTAVVAVAGVIPANTLRAVWLVMIETGRVGDGGLGHGGIGLLCFALLLLPLWWLVAKSARPTGTVRPSTRPRYLERVLLLLAAILAPVMDGSAGVPPSRVPLSQPPADFTFNGLTLPLEPLSASVTERAFAASFPGRLGSYRWGRAQVMLRQVTTATRRLHPSRDCLRAAGFSTRDAVVVKTADGAEWARFTATRDGLRLLVHERIVSEQDGSIWTDIPAWFWSALGHPLNGPWRAETVIHQR
ncbi:MAG: exosortase/archaeosortase family protein [Akkermansiaceae bacterium]|nr:exosortase/archaeosortase family protein [Akkermansiaceae bacterium]MCF7730852.1 exosortase/archaeosortase family protein [Akkermansiaceae bacterium]